jgi:hypothetical protein
MLFVYATGPEGEMDDGTEQTELTEPVGGAMSAPKTKPSVRGVVVLLQPRWTTRLPYWSRLAQTPLWPSTYCPCESGETLVAKPVNGLKLSVAFTVTLSGTAARPDCPAAMLVNALEKARNTSNVVLRVKTFMVNLLAVRPVCGIHARIKVPGYHRTCPIGGIYRGRRSKFSVISESAMQSG